MSVCVKENVKRFGLEKMIMYFFINFLIIISSQIPGFVHSNKWVNKSIDNISSTV